MSNINNETINVLRQVVQLLQQDTNEVGVSASGSNTTILDQPSNSAANVVQGSLSNQPQLLNASSRSLEEHRRLFSRQSRVQPYSSRQVCGRRKRAPAKKEKTITRTLFCFASKATKEAPSSSEKLMLLHNGLGEKRISFPVTANASNVKDLLYEGFPKLRETGGFQLLTSDEKARKMLKVVSHGSCSAEQLRCFGISRIYIRPLQRSIIVNETVKMEDECEPCLVCSAMVPISEMRGHQRICLGDNSSDLEDEEISYTAHNHRSAEINQYFRPISDVVDVSDEADYTENQEINTTTDNDAQEQKPNTIDSTVNLSTSVSLENTGLNETDRPYSYEEHMRNAIDKTLTETTNDEEPVKVLRTFVLRFMRGRKLDVHDPAQMLEGETAEVFVSRRNIYEDGMDELLGGFGHDPSLPIEVTFTGESAHDVGGPRKEFLAAMVREIKERLFVASTQDPQAFTLKRDLVAEDRSHFFGAGLVFGYSMLQGGPLPCFMDNNLLSKLLSVDNEIELNTAEEQLQNGFAKFGLVELLRKRPILLNLLRRSASSELTYPKLVKLFVPMFSEEGSNQRIKENRTYRLFLNYVKEVAAGRREPILLSAILKFATCSENEPVLGYGVQPSLHFRESMESCLPKSNTCINQLTLPIGDIVPGSKEEVFAKFDLTFANDYFGLI